MEAKRSRFKQWLDKLFFGIKTDKDIARDLEEERRINSIILGIDMGHIKRQEDRIYFPKLGYRPTTKYLFKGDYTKAEWDKIKDSDHF